MESNDLSTVGYGMFCQIGLVMWLRGFWNLAICTCS